MDNVDTKIITDGTIEEFILELRRLYNNESITYEITEEGKYVIKNGEKYIFEINRGVNIGDALNMISSDTIIVNELSQTNTPTYQQTDVNKLNTNYQGTTGTYDYNIDVDVDVYNEIISIYKNLIEDLKQSKRHFNPEIMTGELRYYYDSIMQGNDIDQIIDKLILLFEDIDLKIEECITLYEETDEKMRVFLNSMINEVFVIDTTTEEMKNLTLEERQEYLRGVISNLESNLDYLKDICEELYGTNVEFSVESVNEMFHLFDALGLFTTVVGGNSFHGYGVTVDPHQLYNSETGIFDFRQLACMLECIKRTNFIPCLKKYIQEDQSWEESGMEALCGINLNAMYLHQKNNLGMHHNSIDLTGDTEAIFLRNYINGFYNSNYAKEGEFAEFVGYYNNFYGMLSWDEGKYPGVSDYFTSSETPFVKAEDEVRFRDYCEATAEERERARSNGYYLIDELANYFGIDAPVGYMTTVGDLPFPIDYKNVARKVVKKHIYHTDIFESVDYLTNVYDEKTNEYGGLFTLENDIAILSNTVYNYKQYYKLMPYEEYKKDPAYQFYLNKKYDENYTNELLPEDWLGYLDKSELALFDYLISKGRKRAAEGYIEAMTDVVNQRKGFSTALSFTNKLNEDNRFDIKFAMKQAQNSDNAAAYGAAGILWLMNTLFPEQVDDFNDTTLATTTGWIDGNRNFFDGWYDLVKADGVRSEQDYEFMYKMLLLTDPNYAEYTPNLSDGDRQWLSGAYQFGNSIGYMTVPTLLSYIPVVGKAASFISLTGASTGNNADDLMQQGVSKDRAYLYGALMGLSESAVEMLCNGLPGGADNAAKGWFSIVTNSFSEAGEEAFQTYVSRGIECLATGEPYDLLGTTIEAGEAGWMAIWTSAAMSGGGKVFVKAGDVIIETSPSKFNSYAEWRASVESDFRKKHPAVADILIGNVNQANPNEVVLDIHKEEIPADASMQGLIANLKYNTETSSYQVTLINGNTFNVPNLDMVTNNYLRTNFMKNDSNYANVLEVLNEEPNTTNTEESQGVNPEVQPETIVDPNADEVMLKESDATLEEVTPSLDGTVMGDTLVETETTDGTIGISSLPGTLMGTIGFLGDKVKTFGGEVAGLTTDTLTSFNEFVSNMIGGIKANAAKTQIGKLSGDELVTYMDTLDANMLTRKVKGSDGKEITLLEYAWENGFEYADVFAGFFKKIPNVASSSVDIARICIENYKDVEGIQDFVSNLDAEMLTSKVISTNGENVTLLEYAWENGYSFINSNGTETFKIPNAARSNVKVAEMCIANHENVENFQFFVSNLDANMLTRKVKGSDGKEITLLEYAWENGYNTTRDGTIFFEIPEAVKTNLEVAQICIDNFYKVDSQKLETYVTEDYNNFIRNYGDIIISTKLEDNNYLITTKYGDTISIRKDLLGSNNFNTEFLLYKYEHEAVILEDGNYLVKDKYGNDIVVSQDDFESGVFLQTVRDSNDRHEALLVDDYVTNIADNNGKNFTPAQQANIDLQIKELATRIGATPEETLIAINESYGRIINESECGNRVSLDTLERVLKSQLKNQYQTGTSDGLNNPEVRRNTELEVFGIPRTLPAEDAPIYGMLFPKLDGNDSMAENYYRNGPGSQYGRGQGSYTEAVIIYKFDKIKDGTTVTIGDSLDYRHSMRDTRNGNIQSATSISNPKFTGAMSDFLSHVSSLEEIENADLYTFAPTYDYIGDRYLEIQVHGRYNHNVDVIKEVVFLKQPDSDLINLLNSMGIPYRILQ